MDAVSKMYAGIDSARKAIGEMPAKACATKAFVDSIARQSQMIRDDIMLPDKGAIAEFNGIPVHISRVLPKGVLCLLMDSNSKPISMITDETYEPPNNSEDGR